jgi:pimeloyl-ACP methyl ester carboxylesterase
MIDVNGVKLCVDTTGDAADPAILLIGGMGASMDWWEEEFCQRLAAGGRFVIRYDHRDTGRSVSYPAGKPGYTGADPAADVTGVLDALGRRSAHLAGISMGGALAQQVALAHPERVDSLVLFSTSPTVPSDQSSHRRRMTCGPSSPARSRSRIGPNGRPSSTTSPATSGTWRPRNTSTMRTCARSWRGSSTAPTTWRPA